MDNFSYQIEVVFQYLMMLATNNPLVTMILAVTLVVAGVFLISRYVVGGKPPATKSPDKSMQDPVFHEAPVMEFPPSKEHEGLHPNGKAKQNSLESINAGDMGGESRQQKLHNVLQLLPRNLLEKEEKKLRDLQRFYESGMIAGEVYLVKSRQIVRNILSQVPKPKTDNG